MPNSFVMEYNLAGRTRRDLYDRLAAVKQIGLMKLDFEQPVETRMIYLNPSTWSKVGQQALVVFKDDGKGGTDVAIRSSCLRPTQIFDGGQNEKNCLAIRNAIASVLK